MVALGGLVDMLDFWWWRTVRFTTVYNYIYKKANTKSKSSLLLLNN